MIKIIDKFMKIVESIVTSLLGLMVVMVFLQIIWRYLLKAPLSWTDQMTRFTLVWSIMLGIPVMFNNYGAVAFDVLFAKTSGNLRKVLELFIRILGAFFAIVFFAGGLDLNLRSGSLAVPGFPWMKFYMLYVSETVGASLLFIVMVKQTVQLLSKKDEQEVGI